MAVTVSVVLEDESTAQVQVMVSGPSGPSVASSSVMTGKLDDERITVEPLNVYAGAR